MPDDPLDTIAAAALDIAGQGGWAAVTLPAVAGAAGLTLEALHAAVPGGRNALVGAVVQRVDRAMLARCGAPDMGLTPRERLFEVMMARAEDRRLRAGAGGGPGGGVRAQALCGVDAGRCGD